MADFFYDKQIRRFVTQFMRVFIGFKYQTGGENSEERYIPVSYGDISRQVASLIQENSENKLPTIPKIACYITDIQLDKNRLADPSFVSKVNIRERDYEVVDGERIYKNINGGGYTVERLMPTPYTLKLRADIWTSNIDQKLQILEQIISIFNPSIDLQATDNYVDWTSLSSLYLENITFTSRSIPQVTESEYDICTLDFEAPIFINPPAKVKKLGIIQTIISNVYTESGDVVDLEELNYVGSDPAISIRETIDNYGVLLLRDTASDLFICTVIDINEVITALGLEPPCKTGKQIDWKSILNLYGNYSLTSRIHFLQSNGYEISGSFFINQDDHTLLMVNIDADTIPSNTESAVEAIVNPYSFNPVFKFKGKNNIPQGIRYLVLDNVNDSKNVGENIDYPDYFEYDGPDAWKNLDNSDPVIRKNSIIEWTGSIWKEVFNPESDEIHYVTNLTTGIQYKWENKEWKRSFEGEYEAGFWRFELN